MAVLGESRVVNSVLRMMGEETREEVNNYVNDICSRDFMIINSSLQMENVFRKSIDKFISSLSQDELMDLRSYTGYNFRNINAILRGNWTYDLNGVLSQEKREEFRKLADSVSNIVNKFQIPNIDFVTFRGTTINSFSSYGIKEMTEMESLTGKFLYDFGFTSTSLLEDTCYFKKELETGENYNIEIRYLVSSDSNDGALLFDTNATYSLGQNEFLLNKGSLAKVIDVKVNHEEQTAILTAVLIPKKVYEKDYQRDKNGSKNI